MAPIALLLIPAITQSLLAPARRRPLYQRSARRANPDDVIDELLPRFRRKEEAPAAAEPEADAVPSAAMSTVNAKLLADIEAAKAGGNLRSALAERGLAVERYDAELRALIADEKRRFHVFSNEFHRDTYTRRSVGETPNDRNDRAIRVATAWYQAQLDGEMEVLLITNDAENLRLAKEAGLAHWRNGLRLGWRIRLGWRTGVKDLGSVGELGWVVALA